MSIVYKKFSEYFSGLHFTKCEYGDRDHLVYSSVYYTRQRGYDTDGVSGPVIRTFETKNLHIDKNSGKYYVWVSIPRFHDVITDINCEIPDTDIYLVLGDQVSKTKINHETMLVPLLAMYTNIYIRFVLDKESIDNNSEIAYAYTGFLINDPKEREHIRNKTWIESGVLYHNGVAGFSE